MNAVFQGLAGVIKGIFGIFGGLFGAVGRLFSSKSQDAAEAEVQRTPQSTAGGYFLSADDAISFGDVEYMRSTRSTRRTFPKAKLGKDNEFVNSVSSMKKADLKAQAIAEAKLSTSSQQPKTERRRADSNLDMFRNMARDLKKE